MKIIAGRVNWRDMWANRPELELFVDKITYEDMLYSENNGIHYAELDGNVSFFYDNPSNRRGYGGRSFKIKMKDGLEKTLVGPWSSRPGVVNGLGFGPCVDVIMTDKQEEWDYGRPSISGNCTVELVRAAKDIIRIGDGINKCEEYFRFPFNSVFTLAKYKHYDSEICYEPALRLSGGGLWLKTGMENELDNVEDVFINE